MFKALGTRLGFSTAFHPQSDGQSESTIQTLENTLRMCVMDFSGLWDLHLLLIGFVYSNSRHASIEWIHIKPCMEGNAYYFCVEKLVRDSCQV